MVWEMALRSSRMRMESWTESEERWRWVGPESRLKLFTEVVIGEMGFDLCGNNTAPGF